ncbi:MAG: tetratricopeptide repeat protein [Akkermansiaceae bacterium]
MKPLLLLLALASLLPAEEANPEPPQIEPAKPLDVKPSRDVFDLATLYYNSATESKKPRERVQNFRLAAGKFDRFLRAFPKDKKAVDAWYFLALCYRQIDEPEASRTCFETIATLWASGKYVAGSALHLASEDYEKKEWKSAAQWLRILARTTDQPEVRYESLFRRFLCFNKLNDQKEIQASLDAILVDPANPYREKAQLALARLHQNNQNFDKAFPLFVKLAGSKALETSSDSTLQAALCARATGDKKNAVIWFEKALAHPGLGDSRGQTQFTLMNLYFQTKDYKEVIRVFEKGRFELEAQPHLQRLIMASSSYKALGKEKEQLRLYEQILKIAPNSETGFQAAYRILLRDHDTKHREFARHAEDFLAKYAQKRPLDKRLASARLLLAEHYHESKDYRRALSHYQKLPLELVDASNHLAIRYHETKCYLELKMDPEALQSISSFVKDFPKSGKIIPLRLQRSEIFTRLNRQNEALADFQFVLKSTDDHRLKSFLLQRLSGIYQENKNPEKFAATQRQLLTLPGISDHLKASAHFSLGVEDFRNKNYPEAEQKLRIARDLNPGKFSGKAGPLLIRCAYQSGELATLEKEINSLRKADPKAEAPQPILQWLGATLAKQGHHKRAWPFLHDSLKQATTAPVLVWKLYAASALIAGNSGEALRAANARLALETHPYRKAEALFQKSQAHLKLKQFNDARQAIDDALGLHPKGDLNLDLRLFAGDIEMAAQKPEEALRHYVVVESLYAKSKEEKIEATEKLIASLKAINSLKASEQLSHYEKSLGALKAVE